MNTDEYTHKIDSLSDSITKDVRTQITNRIHDVVNKNQDTFLAHWLLKNPIVDFSKIRLNHGFKGDHYEFWITEAE